MNYKNFLKKNKGLIVAILYIISPFDIFPELFLGPVGYIDDVMLLIFLLGQKFFIDYIKSRLGGYVNKGEIDLTKKRIK